MTSTCFASAWASLANASDRASGSWVLSTVPRPAAAIVSSGAASAPVWPSEITSTWTSAPLIAAVTSSICRVGGVDAVGEDEHVALALRAGGAHGLLHAVVEAGLPAEREVVEGGDGRLTVQARLLHDLDVVGEGDDPDQHVERRGLEEDLGRLLGLGEAVVDLHALADVDGEDGRTGDPVAAVRGQRRGRRRLLAVERRGHRAQVRLGALAETGDRVEDAERPGLGLDVVDVALGRGRGPGGAEQDRRHGARPGATVRARRAPLTQRHVTARPSRRASGRRGRCRARASPGTSGAGRWTGGGRGCGRSRRSRRSGRRRRCPGA